MTHIPQDSYYGPELEALIAFFWPNLPAVEELTELKMAFLDRAEYVLTRQMVNNLREHSQRLKVLNMKFSTPSNSTHGSAYWVRIDLCPLPR